MQVPALLETTNTTKHNTKQKNKHLNVTQVKHTFLFGGAFRHSNDFLLLLLLLLLLLPHVRCKLLLER